MAMLVLAQQWVTATNAELRCATVDHKLRLEVAQEIALVKSVCEEHAVPHDVLDWQGWDGTGNLQAEARAARRDLLAHWANEHNLDAVLIGHTRDDAAETFLMRLARGSGVDGLSAMSADFTHNGARFLRPLLDVSREELRDVLRESGTAWAEDSSNEDGRFERVRMRKAMSDLAELGLSQETLLETGRAMARARAALEAMTAEAAKSCAVAQRIGSIHLNGDAYKSLVPEIRNRLMTECLAWVSGAVYRPRFAALQRLQTEILAGKAHTLGGCLVSPTREGFEITRELAAIKEETHPDAAFDERWRFSGGAWAAGMAIRALGDNGLKNCENWREIGYSRAALRVSPSIWFKDDLISAPFAGKSAGWRVHLTRPVHAFLTSIKSH